jgi:hypothetical protein
VHHSHPILVPNTINLQMTPQPRSQSASNEANLQLAIQAFKNKQFQSIRTAAKAFNIDRTSLSRHLRGTTSRRDYTPESKKLTNLEEEAVIRYALHIDSRGV